MTQLLEKRSTEITSLPVSFFLSGQREGEEERFSSKTMTMVFSLAISASVVN